MVPSDNKNNGSATPTPVTSRDTKFCKVETPKTDGTPQPPVPLPGETFILLVCVTEEACSLHRTTSYEVVELNTNWTVDQVAAAILAGNSHLALEEYKEVRAIWNTNNFLNRTPQSFRETTKLKKSNIKNVLLGLKKSTFEKVCINVLMKNTEEEDDWLKT